MDQWKIATCTANGINIYYLRTGGSKPPVVLLHGLMTNGACFSPVARLLENNYDVIMPDARGHGNSSAPERGYSYENLAADVASFIETLGLVKPALIGHSMGGMVAAVVASKFPTLLSALVLADPTFLSPERQREVYESDVAEQHRQILNQPREEYLAQVHARKSNRSRALVDIFAQARLQTSMHAFEILTPPNPDYVQLIDSIMVPTLLVVGDKGAVVSLEMVNQLRARNSHVTFAKLKNAGHALPFDQPHCFSEVITTFLREIF